MVLKVQMVVEIKQMEQMPPTLQMEPIKLAKQTNKEEINQDHKTKQDQVQDSKS